MTPSPRANAMGAVKRIKDHLRDIEMNACNFNLNEAETAAGVIHESALEALRDMEALLSLPTIEGWRKPLRDIINENDYFWLWCDYVIPGNFHWVFCRRKMFGRIELNHWWNKPSKNYLDCPAIGIPAPPIPGERA